MATSCASVGCYLSVNLREFYLRSNCLMHISVHTACISVPQVLRLRRATRFILILPFVLQFTNRGSTCNENLLNARNSRTGRNHRLHLSFDANAVFYLACRRTECYGNCRNMPRGRSWQRCQLLRPCTSWFLAPCVQFHPSISLNIFLAAHYQPVVTTCRQCVSIVIDALRSKYHDRNRPSLTTYNISEEVRVIQMETRSVQMETRSVQMERREVNAWRDEKWTHGDKKWTTGDARWEA